MWQPSTAPKTFGNPFKALKPVFTSLTLTPHGHFITTFLRCNTNPVHILLTMECAEDSYTPNLSAICLKLFYIQGTIGLSGPAEQGRPGGPWPTQLQKIVLQPDGDLAELPVKGMR